MDIMYFGKRVCGETRNRYLVEQRQYAGIFFFWLKSACFSEKYSIFLIKLVDSGEVLKE